MFTFFSIALILIQLTLIDCLLTRKFKISSKQFTLNSNINDAVVSGLKLIPIPDDSTNIIDYDVPNVFDFSFTNDLQNLAIVIGGVGFLTYDRRPRGSARSDLIEIRRSTIPNANYGVFAKKFIPKDTLIGSFPGYITTFKSAMEKKSSEKAKKSAQKYIWGIDEDIILDPTNKDGLLELELTYLFGLIKIDTTIARINEPPVGKDLNAYVRITGTDVEVFTDNDVFANDEIFIDYGLKYNRDDYIDSSNEISKEDEIMKKKLLEEETMKSSKIQSVLYDPANPTEEIIDTSMKGGFLEKLKEQDELLTKSGILSPDEAIKKFADIGSGMFESEEDQEIISSLLGKTTNKKEKVDNNKSIDTKKVNTEAVSKGDDDIYNFFEKQIDKSIDFDKKSGDLVDKESKESAKSKNYDKTAKDNKKILNDLKKESDLKIPNPIDLKTKLEQMDEEKVEKVFQKLQNSLSNNITNELKDYINEYKKIKPKVEINKKLSDVPPVDPLTREKYKNDINLLEKELDNMIRDPMKIWKDIRNDIDKYLTPEEIKEIEKYMD